MNNFWTRAITGLFFVLIVVGLTLFNNISFLILLLIIALGGLFEFYRIVFKNQMGIVHWVFIVSGLFIISSVYFLPKLEITYLIGLLFSCAAIWVLLSKERNWKNVSYLVSGILYIPLPLYIFYQSVNVTDIELNYTEYYKFLALNLFIHVWSSDTFAYICGRSFGKTKLFEAVSPKKTWEGLIGGAVLTITFSFLLSYYWDIPYNVNIAIALCTVVFGNLGDLVESMLKREFSIKDSGKILPGHGGILDRFDALLISLPFTTFCYYLMLRY